MTKRNCCTNDETPRERERVREIKRERYIERERERVRRKDGRTDIKINNKMLIRNWEHFREIRPLTNSTKYYTVVAVEYTPGINTLVRRWFWRLSFLLRVLVLILMPRIQVKPGTWTLPHSLPSPYYPPPPTHTGTVLL